MVGEEEWKEPVMNGDVAWLTPNKDKRFPLSETFFHYYRSTKTQIINDN